jgi:CMP-N-acetylneuraminic acid synthetase
MAAQKAFKVDRLMERLFPAAPSLFGDRMVGYPMPKEPSFGIDTDLDLTMARFLLSHHSAVFLKS